jgi:hypothetical protein
MLIVGSLLFERREESFFLDLDDGSVAYTIICTFPFQVSIAARRYTSHLLIGVSRDLLGTQVCP